MSILKAVKKLQIEVTDLLEIQTDIGIDIARLTRAKLKCDPKDLQAFENSIQRLKDSVNDITDQISTKMKKINKMIKDSEETK